MIGVLPFEGQAIGDLLVKICTSPPPIPSRYNHELPPAFDAWFARTMEREPDRRFQTAAELADALAVAAGMAPRGRSSFDGGRPVSSMGSPVFNPAGATAPILSSGPVRSSVPGVSSPGSYPPITPPPSMHGGAAPGPVTGGPGGGPAVTSAPFTTSMYPSGVPRPRRGLAWSVAGMFALCAAGGIGFLMFHQRDVQDRAVEEHEARVASASGSASGAAPAGSNGLPSATGAVLATGSTTSNGGTPSNGMGDAGAALLQLATPKGTPPVSSDNAGRPGSGHGPHPGKGAYGQTPQPLWVPVPVPVPVPTPVAQPAPQPAPQPVPRPYQPAPAQNQRPVTDQSGF